MWLVAAASAVSGDSTSNGLLAPDNSKGEGAASDVSEGMTIVYFFFLRGSRCTKVSHDPLAFFCCRFLDFAGAGGAATSSGTSFPSVLSIMCWITRYRITGNTDTNTVEVR